MGALISIHAAREGGDTALSNSRSSVSEISIHAAREGGDKLRIILRVGFLFQSTPPVKAATSAALMQSDISQFQSTPPVKAATAGPSAPKGGNIFQSTLPVKAATKIARIFL